MKNEIIVDLVIKAKIELVSTITQFVRKVLEAQNIKDTSVLDGIELITEESCLNTVTHAYGGRANETYRVSLEKYGPKIILAIEDHGLPMDFEKIQKRTHEGIGYKLIWAFADSVKFINLGKNGKRIEFIKDLSLSEVPNKFVESSDDEVENKEEVAPMDTPLEFRLLRSDEGVALARCLFRVYGFSYKEFVYYPEKVKTMIEDGRLVSMVAINPDGEIVAHQGLIKARRESKIAEIGMGIVDPRYRGRKLFETIKEKSFNYIKQQGVLGLFGEAVTKHPYSQKANIATGSRETGILLGYVPTELDFKGFSNEEPKKNKRFATVFMYNRLLKEPDRLVWVPDDLREIVENIYVHGDFARTFGKDFQDEPLNDLSEIDFTTYNDVHLAMGSVKKYGRDFLSQVSAKLIELKNANFACIFLDLPLSRPETKTIYAALREKGFFFCGILPEDEGDDYLRVEYLNNVAMAKEDIVLASDFSKYLLEFIWKEYEETDSRRGQ